MGIVRKMRRNNSSDSSKDEFQIINVESRNCYVCTDCNHITITVHIDNGKTPAFIRCTKPGCNGKAASFMYRLPICLMMETTDGKFKATHEWYLPGRIELSSMNKQQRVKAKTGHLFLRNRTSAKAIESELKISKNMPGIIQKDHGKDIKKT